MGKSAPKAPNPYETAAAQSAANMKAMKASAKFNAVDQYGPWGATKYLRRKDGTPYAQKVTMSAPVQTAFNQQTRFAGRSGQLANKALSNYNPNGFKAGDFDRGRVEDAIYSRAEDLMGDQRAQDRSRQEQMLADRGIPIGSKAAMAEMSRLQDDHAQSRRQNAWTAIDRGGVEEQRALSLALQKHRQPLQDAQMLMGGSPSMQTPQFQGSPGYSAQAPNIAGLINDKYQADMSRYNSRMNGLFGLGSAAIGLLSDVRAKENVERIGQTDSGLPVYRYNYIGDPAVQMGVLAQEAEQVFPEAVHTGPDGLKRVDYARIH